MNFSLRGRVIRPLLGCVARVKNERLQATATFAEKNRTRNEKYAHGSLLTFSHPLVYFIPLWFIAYIIARFIPSYFYRQFCFRLYIFFRSFFISLYPVSTPLSPFFLRKKIIFFLLVLLYFWMSSILFPSDSVLGYVYFFLYVCVS